MLQGWVVVAIALAYIGLLFLVASYGDRMRIARGASSRLLIYPLSLAIYCTSWTFFGSVGLASRTGYDFLTIYIGPLLMVGLLSRCWCASCGSPRARTSPRSPTSSPRVTARARRSPPRWR